MEALVKIFLRLRNAFTRSKVLIQRSMSYIAIANTAMILFLLMSRLEDYGISIDIAKWFFPILILGMTAMIIVGYIDDKLGFHREENRQLSESNPYLKDIVCRLENIEKKIESIKKTKKK